jgi:hypothetical protein
VSSIAVKIAAASGFHGETRPTILPGVTKRVERPLRCEECGVEATAGAWGWRGYRIDDPEDGDLPEIGFFCPDCALREFGPLLDRYDTDIWS